MYTSHTYEKGASLKTAPHLKIYEEVFIATALLHRENPSQADFAAAEIVERVRSLNLTGELRPGVKTHVLSHCVANRRSQPGRHRMLYATRGNRRRLFLAGDDVHPGRDGAIFPEPESLPRQYMDLVEWAKQRYNNGGGQPRRWLDGILGMTGMGKELWKGEDPDEYIRHLREGWE